MNHQLMVVGYLNSFARDVTPVAATPLFQVDGKRYVREGEQRREIDKDQLEELEHGGWLNWELPQAIPSDDGRILVHDNPIDLLYGNEPPGLLKSYLLPGEEQAKRNELATAYLNRALNELYLVIGNNLNSHEQHFDAALTHLGYLARARPDLVATRALRAVITDYCRNIRAVNAELAETQFELSRYGIREWDLDLWYDHTIARGWRNFIISQDGVRVIAESEDGAQRVAYEASGGVDTFGLWWFQNVSKLVTECAPLKPYRELITTVSLFQLLASSNMK
jgi:hypothetical protein